MVELKGTEKQVKYAEAIRENLINAVNEKSVPQIFHIFANTEKGKNFIEELKKVKEENPNFFTNEYVGNQYVIAQIRALIEEVEDSKIFIENQSLLSFLSVILK